MEKNDIIGKILAFLDQIGLPYSMATIENETFLPGLKIDQGALVIDIEKLTYPGDILHEAGHIALTAPQKRPHLNQEIMDAIPDTQSVEMGVILWTYLAGHAIQLPMEHIFHAGGYKGNSNWLMDLFQQKNYMGLPLLNWMGVTEPNPEGDVPKVLHWYRQND
jgi:hypothetical protein